MSTPRWFTTMLNSVSKTDKKTRRKYIDKSMASALSDGDKEKMMNYIIRCRHPVIEEFIPSNVDKNWLHAMGYMYKTESKGKSLPVSYTFIHTSEHKII